MIAWLDQRLPTDGSSPEGFLDREVTARIVAGLSSGTAPVRVAIVDDLPAVLEPPLG